MTTMLETQDWTFPVPIAYGVGRLQEIGAMCAKAGMSRPLVVTDRGSRDLPFIGTIALALQKSGLASDLFTEICPNPRDDEIAAGRAVYRQGMHDGIVGVGGGSGMDAAKAICLVANNDLDLWTFNYDNPSPDMRDRPAFPPLICVPTTAGTGAETESTAMITDTARLMKWCVWHPELKPAVALLDPNVTVGLPRDLTAWTGCDAMVHAIEAYCVPDFHPLCDGIALEALRLNSTWLRSAVTSPGNLEARGAMLVGSCLAGVSFLKGLGLVHAISHMIGASYDTHHGLTNAILLPSILRFNEPAIAAKALLMADAMALDDKSFSGFYDAICTLLDDLSIPKTLTAIGVPSECAAAMAKKALQDAAASTNPRPSTEADIKMIIEDALNTGR
ncbi:MAG: iron-containing alcohol dehydrogenase [Geminicoccales bacterium]